MKVREIMSTNAKICALTDNLSVAAGLMWENDCGVLPVVAEDEKVVGLITDRDICMAANLNNRNLWNIAVGDVISRNLFACKPEDDIHAALNTMQENKVRRLPVIGADGTLEGILSMNDIVLNAEEPKGKKAPDLSYADVVTTYKSICKPRLQPQTQAAVAGV